MKNIECWGIHGDTMRSASRMAFQSLYKLAMQIHLRMMELVLPYRLDHHEQVIIANLMSSCLCHNAHDSLN